MTTTTYSTLMQTVRKLGLTCLGLLSLYFTGYVFARLAVFHTVEMYPSPEGKAGPRQDYIAKRDQPPGAGWEYQLFLPAIKVEEGIINYFQNQ